MPKYEILLIVDPKAISTAEKLVKDVFHDGVKTMQKLDRTELAYEINKTKIANYLLIEAEVSGEAVREFVRRANIASKTIWRHLVVNLDNERAVASLNAKPRFRPRREGQQGPARQATPERPVSNE